MRVEVEFEESDDEERRSERGPGKEDIVRRAIARLAAVAEEICRSSTSEESSARGDEQEHEQRPSNEQERAFPLHFAVHVITLFVGVDRRGARVEELTQEGLHLLGIGAEITESL